jgi:hypothetical protein
MKGIQGLILALALGIAGALFNWAYLASRAKEVEMREFVAIAPGTSLNRGDTIREEQLARLSIPAQAVGNLGDFAVLYSARQTVIGRPVWRVKLGGALLLTDDLRTPPPELVIGQNPGPDGEEVGLSIPVGGAMVTSLFDPGDLVSFVTNTTHYNHPTLAAKPAEAGKDAAKGAKPVPVTDPSVPITETEIIGPFKILALGNRLGNLDVMKANRMSPAQENVLTISVKLVDGALEPKAQKLLNMINATNGQQFKVIMYSRKKKL